MGLAAATRERNAVENAPRLRLVAGVMLLAVTAGCTSWSDYIRNGFKVGPNYCPPAAPVADHWIDDASPNVGSEPAQDAAWWQTFNDPVLDSLMQAAYRQNLSLRIAGWRILEARAQRGIAVGNLFPQLQQASGDYTRNQISKTSPNVTPVLHYDEWTLGTSLAWELDFWGRFRRAIESADAKLDSSVENYDDVLVLLLSEVAQSYVSVRTAEQRLVYAQQNVADQRKSLNLAEVKFRQRRHDAARRDPGPIEPVANRGHDPALAGGSPAGRQPALHPAGNAAAQHRRDARQADHSHGLAAGGGGRSRRPVAAPARRPPRRARGRRPVRPDRHRHGRTLSPFLDHRHDLLRHHPVQGPLRGRLAGGQRRTDLQLEHPELRPAGEQHSRAGRQVPAVGPQLSEYRA